MLDVNNKEQRFIMTPSGRAWMFGFDGEKRITVHFEPEGMSKVGSDKSYEVSECEEAEE